MSQFDIHTNPFRRSRERQPFLIILQNDLISRGIDTVVVAPLEIASGGKFASRLNPAVVVDNRSFVLIAQELLTIRKSVPGTPRAPSPARSHHRGARYAFHRSLSRR
jgi:hypothetical protein